MPAKTIHGMTKTRTFRIWAAMRWRCEHNHPDYGGRGVKVCERWQSFVNFLADVGEIPPGMSLDRIDNDGNYEPANIRLTKAKEQSRNRRNTRLITINGVTKSTAEWIDESGLPKTTFFNRLGRGWTGEKLLAPSGSTRDKPITIDGRTMTIAQWSRETGIASTRIRQRLKVGWSPERAIQRGGSQSQAETLLGRGIKAHGMTNTRTYRIWNSMLTRCRQHPLYAGRVKVCERWQSFVNFLADVGEIPPGMSLDRIDPRGDYEPGNVRQATSKEQARNRTSNRLVTIKGQTKTLAEWAEEAGISGVCLMYRINQGYPEERLLEASREGFERLATINGETKSLAQWANDAGLHRNTVYRRLKLGWTIEEALLPGSFQFNHRKATVRTIGKKKRDASTQSRFMFSE